MSTTSSKWDNEPRRDCRLELFAQWISARLHLSADPIPIASLFEQLKRLYPKRRSFPFKTAASLGSWLGRSKAVIREELGARVIPGRSAQTRFWTFKEVRCHVVGNPPCETGTVPVHDVMAAANSDDLWLDAID